MKLINIDKQNYEIIINLSKNELNALYYAVYLNIESNENHCCIINKIIDNQYKIIFNNKSNIEFNNLFDYYINYILTEQIINNVSIEMKKLRILKINNIKSKIIKTK